MQKKLIRFFTIALFLSFATFLPFLKVKAALTLGDAYKGIVKIYTYYEGSHGDLTTVYSGSGVIITNDGVILTNRHIIHVEDNFKEELPVAFKICLTTATTEKPLCTYGADLIAKDEDRDVALLKIRNIGILNKVEFSNIERLNVSIFKDGDSVQALGYPGAGGETITGTTGTISGTLDKNNLNWIKTNALVSFGSSGGALIDMSGKLIGITSAANQDVGYAINITSINDWINKNINKGISPLSLSSRMDDLIKKQYALKAADKFINDIPHIEITRPQKWEFNYDNENSISLTNQDKPNSGFVILSWTETDTNFQPMMDIYVKSTKMTTSCFAAGNFALSNKEGRAMICLSGGEVFNSIFLPSKNYAIELVYYSGKDNVDQDIIWDAIKSIVITDEGNNFAEKHSYEYSHPYFKINIPEDWSLMGMKNHSHPLSGQTTAVPELGFEFYILEQKNEMKNLNNENYFDLIKNEETVKTGNEGTFKLKADRYFLSTNYKINNELTNEIFYKYRFKDENDGDKIKMYAAGFRIREEDRIILIEFNYLGEDEKLFEQYLADFQKSVLTGLSLGRPVAAQPETNIPNQSAAPAPSQSNNQQASAQQSAIVLAAKDIKNVGKKLMGKILLQVESGGKAWYVCPTTNQAHYLGRPADAFNVMRERGMGIINKDLEKIPVGLIAVKGSDSDGDGLSDSLEDAIGTDKNKADSDGDGQNDKAEVETGSNPKGSGKISINNDFSNKQKGKIFLQVQGKGEAWYINPNDGKRYFLGRPEDAFNVMRTLGLGVSNKDFENL